MKIYTFNYKNQIAIFICLCASILGNAQVTSTNQVTDSSFFKRIKTDTSKQKLNMDGVYDKPFLSVGKLPIALGGYMEANTQYSGTNGVPSGFSFQARRVSIFLESSIAKSIKFNSEIEFANGGNDIEVEYAFLDMEFHPLFNLRGGIIVNPIGSFNENHDGPKWDFVDRPLSSTTIIPSTLSEAGFGVFGKYFNNGWSFGYEAYLTNGFDEGIILNSDGHTSLADGNQNPNKFTKTNSGLPMFTGKIAIRNRAIGEFGISYLTDVYNKWQTSDGLIIAPKRSASILAGDFQTTQFNNKLTITTEVAKVYVQLPDNYNQNYGSQQWGGFIDFVYTIIQHKMFDWEHAKFELALRLQYIDYNIGTFKETGGNIYDDLWAITPGIAFRPVGSTVLRLNYGYQWQRDIFGNTPVKTATIQFGVSTYF
jgi:hypothetical protein